MKTLLLMRHAKSSWGDVSLSDSDRPLNERGERTAPFMGEFMREKGLEPSIIICSPAARAKRTAELVKEAARWSCELRFDERIYEASPRTLIEVVSETDEMNGSLMLVGHNPGMEGLIRLLTGELHPMPTAALAVIDVDIDSWARPEERGGKLIHIFRPKELTSM